MIEKDPVRESERLVREIHDRAGSYTKPVLERYPLLFAFLLTFSLAAIMRGVNLLMDEVTFLHDNPILLVLGGSLLLFITGMLYKLLEKKG